MFSIFNGQERRLGRTDSAIYMQVSVEMRDHLHELKGARLAVFLSIALHSDSNGWSSPSIELIASETGYNPKVISRTIKELKTATIKGERILLAFQPRREGGGYQSNSYLIFPTKDEVAKYEKSQGSP